MIYANKLDNLCKMHKFLLIPTKIQTAKTVSRRSRQFKRTYNK